MKKKLVALVAAFVSLAAGSDGFETRKARVRALLERQEFNAALEQATSIQREWADDIVAYQLIAEAQLGLGNYEQAEAAIQWMLDLRIGKADSEGWLLVARFREVTGDVDGAIEAANLAYGQLAPAQDRNRRVLLAYLGRLHYLAGRLDIAEQALGQALAGGENTPEALETLARVRLARGRRAEAVRILQQLCQSSAHPRYLYLLAETTRDQADFAAFEQAARKCASTEDKANRDLTLYLAGPGKRPAEALEIARRESALRHDVYTLDALAVALFANGERGQARELMKRVLAVGTRDPDILAHAARIGVRPQ